MSTLALTMALLGALGSLGLALSTWLATREDEDPPSAFNAQEPPPFLSVR